MKVLHMRNDVLVDNIFINSGYTVAQKNVPMFA